MVGTTGGEQFASLGKIMVPLESERRDEFKYVLLNNVAPQLILKTQNLANYHPHFIGELSLTIRHIWGFKYKWRCYVVKKHIFGFVSALRFH